MCSRIRAFSACTTAPRITARPARALVISASFKNRETIDLSQAEQYKRHETDVGSPEYQVARLSARITHITNHLKANRKDNAAKRGLVALLSQRKSLLKYLYGKDRAAYAKLCATFNVRNVVMNDVRGASRVQEPSPVSPTAA